MTSRARKKLQKEKTRRKIVKEKLRKRREAGKASAREEKDELKAQREFEKSQRELIAWEEQMEEFYSKLPPETRKQVERNIEILKALEEEHEREKSEKQALNEALEKEGHITPEGKMQALQDIAMQKQKAGCNIEELAKIDTVETQVGMGGSADCSFDANKS